MLNIGRAFLKTSMLIILFLTLSLTAACSWVKKSPGAEKVRIVPIDRVADCKVLGNVVASTTGNVAIIKRNAHKVKRELETIAQNEAASSGADTIAAISAIADGMQTFTMYRCL